MNVMTILVPAIFIICAVSGLVRGMTSKLSGVLSLVISSLLVSAMLPGVTSYLRSNMGIYTFIEQKCESLISDQVTKTLTGAASGGSDSSGESVDRSQIAGLMNQYGLDSSRLDGMTDEQIEEYVENYLKPYLAPYTNGKTDSLDLKLSEGATVLDSLGRIEQTKLIQSLPIPDFLQNLMLTYNNKEGYSRLKVTGFGGYLSAFVANVALNILSFLITLIIVWVIVRLILAALHLASRMYVIRTVDRIGGLAVGLIQGLLITWIIFLIISILSGTQIGSLLMKMIDSNALLKPVYDGNLLMKSVVRSMSNIM